MTATETENTDFCSVLSENESFCSGWLCCQLLCSGLCEDPVSWTKQTMERLAHDILYGSGVALGLVKNEKTLNKMNVFFTDTEKSVVRVWPEETQGYEVT